YRPQVAIGDGTVKARQKCPGICPRLLLQVQEFICVTLAKVTWRNSLVSSKRAGAFSIPGSLRRRLRKPTDATCSILAENRSALAWCAGGRISSLWGSVIFLKF